MCVFPGCSGIDNLPISSPSVIVAALGVSVSNNISPPSYRASSSVPSSRQFEPSLAFHHHRPNPPNPLSLPRLQESLSQLGREGDWLCTSSQQRQPAQAYALHLRHMSQNPPAPRHHHFSSDGHPPRADIRNNPVEKE